MADNYSCVFFKDWPQNREQLKAISIFFIIETGLIVLPIAFLNGLIILTIYRSPTLHTPSNIFLCNMALSDLIVAVVAIPTLSAWRITEIRNTDPETVCFIAQASSMVGVTVGGVSFLSITVATLDRYLAVKLHLRYVSVVTTYRACLVCLALWLACFIASFSLLLGMLAFHICTLVVLPFCMTVVLFCHIKIFKVVKQQQSKIRNSVMAVPGNQVSSNAHRLKKSISVLKYVFILHLILYGPFLSSCVVEVIIEEVSLDFLNVWVLTIALLLTNSALNPLIYCWRLKEVRSAMHGTFQFYFNKLRHGISNSN